MSRFQAQTNAVLDEELEEARERLGLRPHQKSDLLRELTSLATWVIRQAAEGYRIEARSGGKVEILKSPTLERLQNEEGMSEEGMSEEGMSEEGMSEEGMSEEGMSLEPIRLNDDEVTLLAAILEKQKPLTLAMRASLKRLASSRRKPPRLRWKNG